MRGWCREVSGHHLLPHHWVSDRALSRVNQTLAKTLGWVGPGAGDKVSEEEAESMDGKDSWTKRQAAGGGRCMGMGVGESLSEEEAEMGAEGHQWKGH